MYLQCRSLDKMTNLLHYEYMENNTKKGFDDRIVNYEYIHGGQEIDYKNLLAAIDAKPDQIILDGCGGYMDISKRILDQFLNKDNKPEIYVLDESTVQLGRAKEKNIIPEDHLIQGDIAEISFSDAMFDTVVVKMGMHEMPLEKQKAAFQECYRALRPGGKLVVWDLSLPDNEMQKLFQDIIREKDRLCGFDFLVKNRYFQKHSELVELFKQAKFKNVRDEFPIRSHLSMERRLSEFISKDRLKLLRTKGSISNEDENRLSSLAYERLKKLCDYIRGRIPENMKERLLFKDTGSNIEFTIDKIIMSGKK